MIGVALSGGGTKGAFQAGVIQSLNISPDIVCGTSIGALNAMVWSFKGIDELARTWQNIKSRSDWLTLNWQRAFIDGIYRTEKLQDWLIEIRKSGVAGFKSYASRVCIETGELEFIGNHALGYVEAVIDSATVPIAMRPRLNYWDGGVREKTPLKFLIEQGCSEIHVILNNPLSKNPEHAKKPGNPVSIAMRVIDILTHEGANDDILSLCKKSDKKVTFYAPEHYLYDTFCFEGELLKDAFRQGLAARAISPGELWEIIG